MITGYAIKVEFYNISVVDLFNLPFKRIRNFVNGEIYSFDLLYVRYHKKSFFNFEKKWRSTNTQSRLVLGEIW